MLMTGLIVMIMGGCSSTKNVSSNITKHPDAPMLILNATGKAQVAIYDAETQTLVKYGGVDLSRLEGWTISKFDWEEYRED